jgi:DNA-binding NarL/FixJ family response regulator
MKRITIAVADGNISIRKALGVVLKSEKSFDLIAECDNGYEAAEMAGNLKPDIMLVEIVMDPVDGFEATGLIKKVSPGTKVIGFSIYAHPGYVKRMIQSGASGYITKGSSKEEIIKGIIQVHEGGEYICNEISSFYN